MSADWCISYSYCLILKTTCEFLTDTKPKFPDIMETFFLHPLRCERHRRWQNLLLYVREAKPTVNARQSEPSSPLPLDCQPRVRVGFSIGAGWGDHRWPGPQKVKVVLIRSTSPSAPESLGISSDLSPSDLWVTATLRKISWRKWTDGASPFLFQSMTAPGFPKGLWDLLVFQIKTKLAVP